MLNYRNRKLEGDRVLDTLNVQKSTNIHMNSVLRSNENSYLKYRQEHDFIQVQVNKVQEDLRCTDYEITIKDRELEELDHRLSQVDIHMGPLKNKLYESDLKINRKNSSLRDVESHTFEKNTTYKRIQDRCLDVNGRIDGL